jgi:DNA mismatch repair protein MutL
VALSRIARLPDDLVNKIAAGEVVERPSSVVKELVENALDAGAAKVSVEIEGGGKRLIRVRDDGSGMAREDALLALERHATSKLHSFEGLQQVATHGFRGEALPSIASVSHLLLRTRDDSGPAGTEVEVRHGRPEPARDAGHPRGTTVEVRDLFGAVPARRKFLRSDATEAGHVAEAVTLLALAHPGTGFALRSGARDVLDAPPAANLGARLYQIFGGDLLAGLAPVEGGEAGVRVYGFVSRPGRPGPSRPSLRLFVNGRPVRDRALWKAVGQAYQAAGAGERPFEAFLFVDLPLDLVDVNVHPSKAEVRFADARAVFTAVERAVREALTGARAGLPAAPLGDEGGRALGGASLSGPALGASRVEEAVQRYLSSAAATPERGAHGPARATTTPAASPADAGAPEPVALFSGGTPAVLGQHRLTYIVTSDGDELILVDQHTAHERVRFERVQARLEARSVESQLLLAPALVALEPALMAVFEEHAESLQALGYETEPFGGGSLRVGAMPALMGTRDPGPALRDLLRDFLERGTGEWLVTGARDRLAATLACHSAVRAGQALTQETMRAIVRDLESTQHPLLCPHGRPTVVRIPRDDLSRWFGRVGWRRA